MFQRSNEGVWHFHGGGSTGDRLPATEITNLVSGSTRLPNSSASTFNSARDAVEKSKHDQPMIHSSQSHISRFLGPCYHNCIVGSLTVRAGDHTRAVWTNEVHVMDHQEREWQENNLERRESIQYCVGWSEQCCYHDAWSSAHFGRIALSNKCLQSLQLSS